jgi:hypothetical protein
MRSKQAYAFGKQTRVVRKVDGSKYVVASLKEPSVSILPAQTAVSPPQRRDLPTCNGNVEHPEVWVKVSKSTSAIRQDDPQQVFPEKFGSKAFDYLQVTLQTRSGERSKRVRNTPYVRGDAISFAALVESCPWLRYFLPTCSVSHRNWL